MNLFQLRLFVGSDTGIYILIKYVKMFPAKPRRGALPPPPSNQPSCESLIALPYVLGAALGTPSYIR